MTYTWYLTGKKSTEVVEYAVDVTDGNGKLIRTMTMNQFQHRVKGN